MAMKYTDFELFLYEPNRQDADSLWLELGAHTTYLVVALYDDRAAPEPFMDAYLRLYAPMDMEDVSLRLTPEWQVCPVVEPAPFASTSLQAERIRQYGVYRERSGSWAVQTLRNHDVLEDLRQGEGQ